MKVVNKYLSSILKNRLATIPPTASTTVIVRMALRVLLTLKSFDNNIWCKCLRSGLKGDCPCLMRWIITLMESNNGSTIIHNTKTGLIKRSCPWEAEITSQQITNPSKVLPESPRNIKALFRPNIRKLNSKNAAIAPIKSKQTFNTITLLNAKAMTEVKAINIRGWPRPMESVFRS